LAKSAAFGSIIAAAWLLVLTAIGVFIIVKDDSTSAVGSYDTLGNIAWNAGFVGLVVTPLAAGVWAWRCAVPRSIIPVISIVTLILYVILASCALAGLFALDLRLDPSWANSD
jgi:hypothetical protein